jgi:hypothetical protein
MTSSTLTIGTGFVLSFVFVAMFGARFDARPKVGELPQSIADRSERQGTALAVPSLPEANQAGRYSAAQTGGAVGLAAVRPPAAIDETGSVDARAEAAGHRLFVDGRVVGQTPCEAKVRCGSHVVQVGSGGLPHRVTVPCGGVVRASPERT